MKILNLYAGIGGNRKLWYSNIDKRKTLRNMVNSKIGFHILQQALNIDTSKQKYLFN